MPQLNNQPRREIASWNRSKYPVSGKRIMSLNKLLPLQEDLAPEETPILQRYPVPQEDLAPEETPILQRYPVPQEYEPLTADPAPRGAPLPPASGAAPGRRRGASKRATLMKHRERYPNGRIKEIRPRPTHDPERLAQMRAGERLRSERYKAKKRLREIAMGYRNPDGTFTEEAKKLEKERRIAGRGAKLRGQSAATPAGGFVPEQGAGMGPQMTVAKGEGTFEGFKAQDISVANAEASFNTTGGDLMALAAIMGEI